MKAFGARLLKKHRGATLIDYAILLGCIAIVAIGVTRALGEKIENIFGNISNSFELVDKGGGSGRCEYCWGALPVPDDEKEEREPKFLLLFPLYPLIGCEEAVADTQVTDAPQTYRTCPTCHRNWFSPPPEESPFYKERVVKEDILEAK